jgi:hypothetical protein
VSIPVIWFEGNCGSRSGYADCGLLHDAFDYYRDMFLHYSGPAAAPSCDTAVVVIHGNHLQTQTDIINEWTARISSVLFIVHGDEKCEFPAENLHHPNFKLWRQTPRPNTKADRFIALGYPCDTHQHMALNPERPLAWSFLGQVTHARREELASVLRTLRFNPEYPNCFQETRTFFGGFDRATYFRKLGMTKITPCPSGPESADTLRLYESLESGCIPIVDERPGYHPNENGYWRLLFPEGTPFPIIDDWSGFEIVLRDILNNYSAKSKEVADWWIKYKKSYFSWLKDDLEALQIH